jgi:hypothetical protein
LVRVCPPPPPLLACSLQVGQAATLGLVGLPSSMWAATHRSSGWRVVPQPYQQGVGRVVARRARSAR